MKAPKSHGLTMRQLKAYKKISKGRRKQYWQGQINALADKPAYKKWLISLSSCHRHFI